ncbi:GyrI-like domain-containing protein [Peribacillus kribbensis]|uniref:GyrI-like domain-containing protein n=1 Tax=Peribacillus kribbensis TaxID=356658 RepID=UPI0003F88A8F|nr:GyrI-like domain-containing protein [Peribacillus kribbensis]
MSKTQRILQLIEIIKQKRSFTVSELADEFEVSYRTMWRYLQELSALGIALYAEPGSGGGYRLLDKDTKDGSIDIIYKPESCYIGYEFTSPYSAKEETEILAPRLWIRLLSRVREIQSAKQPIIKTALGQYRKKDFSYYITVEVENPAFIPKDMISIKIPARYYAKKRHRHSIELGQVIGTYEEIYAWVKKSRWIPDRDSCHLEVYGADFRGNSRQANFDIYVPLENGETVKNG